MQANPCRLGVRCKLCGGSVAQKDAHYCQPCAYKHGICGMCGVKLHDISLTRQRNI